MVVSAPILRAVQFQVPQIRKKKKGGLLGTIGSVVGSVGGALIGGPVGAVIGGQVGGMAGKLAGGGSLDSNDIQNALFAGGNIATARITGGGASPTPAGPGASGTPFADLEPPPPIREAVVPAPPIKAAVAPAAPGFIGPTPTSDENMQLLRHLRVWGF